MGERFSLQMCKGSDSESSGQKDRLGSNAVFDYYLEDEKWNSFLNEEERDIYIKDCLKNSDQVQQEDDFICNAVQRGLESSGYDVGRYAPKVEMADHQFHLLLAQSYHNHFNEKSTTTIAKK